MINTVFFFYALYFHLWLINDEPLVVTEPILEKNVLKMGSVTTGKLPEITGIDFNGKCDEYHNHKTHN